MTPTSPTQQPIRTSILVSTGYTPNGCDEIIETCILYLPIITKYGIDKVATARLVPKLDTYDTNVSMRGTKRTLIAPVATEMRQTISMNRAKIGQFRHTDKGKVINHAVQSCGISSIINDFSICSISPLKI